MSAKKNKSDSTPKSPTKRLILNREKVKDLNIRSGVKTGATSGCRSGSVASVVASVASTISGSIGVHTGDPNA
jgi:hypothetical protein